MHRPNGPTNWIQQSQALKTVLRKPGKLAKNSSLVYMKISTHNTVENASQLQIAMQIKMDYCPLKLCQNVVRVASQKSIAALAVKAARMPAPRMAR